MTKYFPVLLGTLLACSPEEPDFPLCKQDQCALVLEVGACVEETCDLDQIFEEWEAETPKPYLQGCTEACQYGLSDFCRDYVNYFDVERYLREGRSIEECRS